MGHLESQEPLWVELSNELRFVSLVKSFVFKQQLLIDIYDSFQE